MKCSWCTRTLTPDLDLVYSNTYGEYFCSAFCAEEAYITRADIKPVSFQDLPDDEDDEIEVAK